MKLTKEEASEQGPGGEPGLLAGPDPAHPAGDHGQESRGEGRKGGIDALTGLRHTPRPGFVIERKPPAQPVVPKSISYTDKKYPPLV